MAARWRVVGTLGTAQTLAWASSYYLPAMLAVPIARELGLAVPTVFAAFSLALVVSALLGPLAGRAIDRWGGHRVLPVTSMLFAAGLLALSQVQGPWGLFAAWALIGVGMGSGLYEAAFASLVRLYRQDARNAITGITLLAGFASTVGWPLSSLFEAQFGWRGACVAWAGLHLLLGLPLNLWLPAQAPAADPQSQASAPVPEPPPLAHPVRVSVLLGFVFAATWFTSTAMAAHLPTLLQAQGLSLAAAVGIGALVGPAQVAGRLLEFGWLRRLHPLFSARMATLAHPVGAAALLTLGGAVAAPFALLHGLGNGILTIAKGSLPLVLFGSAGYGARQGWMMLPARLATAAAPVLFGVFLQWWGAAALWVCAGLGLAAFAALWWVQPPRVDAA